MNEIWDLTQCVVEDFGYAVEKSKPLKDCFIEGEEEVFEKVGLRH